ncbi:hypothetical protein E4K10_23255 [Streptomyces sp. T1317-0309]|nr:hypothetical protein E4K10_23255 [Streptomyces sp. T1317-0309]
MTAVISANPVTDWGNPNVIRASKGTVFAVPIASAESEDVVRWLAEHSVNVVATTPDTDPRWRRRRHDRAHGDLVAARSTACRTRAGGPHTRRRSDVHGQVTHSTWRCRPFHLRAVRQRMASR